jgi:type II secretion system protein J
MLIALAIGAGIAVMAYSALDGTIKADQRVSAVTKSIDEVDRVWQYLGRDLLFAVERTWFNNSGEQKSAMIGVFGDRLSQSDVTIANEDDYLLQFIRGNRENLLDQPRSNLYLVGYRLTQEEGSELKTLWRDRWSPVDGSGEPNMQQRRLLDGIDSMSFRYLSPSFQSLENASWITGWPGGNNVSNGLPAAVEVTIESAVMGKVIRLFPLSVTDS